MPQIGQLLIALGSFRLHNRIPPTVLWSRRLSPQSLAFQRRGSSRSELSEDPVGHVLLSSELTTVLAYRPKLSSFLRAIQKQRRQLLRAARLMAQSPVCFR